MSRAIDIDNTAGGVVEVSTDISLPSAGSSGGNCAVVSQETGDIKRGGIAVGSDSAVISQISSGIQSSAVELNRLPDCYISNYVTVAI